MKLEYEHLVGRPFIMGKNDCLAIVRDFYRDNFNITIRNYARPVDWSSDKLDLIRLLYEREGFELIADFKPADLRPGDLLAMSIGESNPNHFAVLLHDNLIVHHITNRLSNFEEFREFWRKTTSFVLRHPAVPDLRPVYPDVDIGTLLNARYRLQLDADADGSGDA